MNSGRATRLLMALTAAVAVLAACSREDKPEADPAATPAASPPTASPTVMATRTPGAGLEADGERWLPTEKRLQRRQERIEAVLAK
jgi:hypothetical protein